jgi:hypothetical protein
MEAVYAAGTLDLRPDDRPARTVAAVLASLGFVQIEEIAPDGTSRRLGRGERSAAGPLPWRVVKADLGLGSGIADAGAPAFLGR